MKKLKELLISYLKKLISDTHSAILSTIIGTVSIGSLTVIVIYIEEIYKFLMSILLLATPLWVTIFLVVALLVYIYVKLKSIQKTSIPPEIRETLIEEFGVFWNNEYKKRCLRCKYPLKNSSPKFGTSVFFCSNCNEKHVLKNTDGLAITEKEAINILKNKNIK